jgi:methyl-accepting chemotaxis protein
LFNFDDSVLQVDQGAKLVGEASQTMQEIIGAVQRVANIMREIDTASGEQASGIEQVNRAVGEMDEGTQHNAALVEQAAAAADSLNEQAAQLAQAVAVFQLPRASGGKVLPLQGRVTSHAPQAPQAALAPARARSGRQA